MSFISNADNFTLGEGVYNNVHGDIIHNNFYGRKHHREGIEDELDPILLYPRRRWEGEDGIKIIRKTRLKLTREIGSGPGYFLYAGQHKERAVIVKAFNPGPTARERLESTVALSKTLMHPNVLGIEGPLAAALKDDLTRSITLGFKMVAGLSAGMNYLNVQGISLGAMGAQNFDIFLEVDDRFIISINPPSLKQGDAVEVREQRDEWSWDIFNALCQKVLRSANRVLYNEQIDREPVTLDSLLPTFSDGQTSLASASGSTSSHNIPEETPPVPPRREYLWRTIDRGQQSLASVASRITWDLDLELSPLNRLASTDASPHRCPGYVREEITLTTTTAGSAVVSHYAPSPGEICSVCKEVVGFGLFNCICGDPDPGARHTTKCRVCKRWSHCECVGKSKDFTCVFCVPGLASTIPLNITTAQRSHDILLNETTDVTVVADVEPDSQQMSSAASFNNTARGALDGPLESHDIVPEVASQNLVYPQHQYARYRTTLNNVAQRWGQLVEYNDSQTGSLEVSHWTSVVYLNRVEYGRGIGSSRGSARERAARQALVALGIVQA